jgi:hypothetical protein
MIIFLMTDVHNCQRNDLKPDIYGEPLPIDYQIKLYKLVQMG